MGASILHLAAEDHDGEWSVVAEPRGRAEAVDELASWQGPRLSHGDMARLVCGAGDTLFVFDADRSSFVEVKRASGLVRWVTMWSRGSLSSGYDMMLAAKRADPRRLVLAACDCASAAVTRRAPDARSLEAIRIARLWARGGLRDARGREAIDRAASDALASSAALFAAPDRSLGVGAAAHSALYAVSSVAERANDGLRSLAAMAVDLAELSDSDGGEPGRSRASERVRWFIPLSVLACSLVGARDPLPIPRADSAQLSGVRP